MATHPEYFPNKPAWYNWLTNHFPLMIDDQSVHTIAVAWLFTEQGKWNFKPRIVHENWQYVNAVFSVRFGFPLALFVQFRTKNHILQLGIGWKQSGRFAIHCRLQTDASAAAGAHDGMPNNGQAIGFEFGGK